MSLLLYHQNFTMPAFDNNVGIDIGEAHPTVINVEDERHSGESIDSYAERCFLALGDAKDRIQSLEARNYDMEQAMQTLHDKIARIEEVFAEIGIKKGGDLEG